MTTLISGKFRKNTGP